MTKFWQAISKHCAVLCGWSNVTCGSVKKRSRPQFSLYKDRDFIFVKRSKSSVKVEGESNRRKKDLRVPEGRKEEIDENNLRKLQIGPPLPLCMLNAAPNAERQRQRRRMDGRAPSSAGWANNDKVSGLIVERGIIASFTTFSIVSFPQKNALFIAPTMEQGTLFCPKIVPQCVEKPIQSL